LRIRAFYFLAALASLACVHDVIVPERRSDTPAPGSVEEQRAASGAYGLRGSGTTVLTGSTVTLSESMVTSAITTRTSSASYVMLSSVRMGVE